MSLICFASPKGGVGKTTLAANIADGLQRLGHRVLAIDLDAQNALRLHFGVPLSDRVGFMAGLRSGGDWRGQLRQTASGVRLLPHGATDLRGALDLGQVLLLDTEGRVGEAVGEVAVVGEQQQTLGVEVEPTDAGIVERITLALIESVANDLLRSGALVYVDEDGNAVEPDDPSSGDERDDTYR